nr:MAG TPA: hypothetical protein [Caudoviricetes sp.]
MCLLLIEIKHLRLSSLSLLLMVLVTNRGIRHIN